MSMRRAEMTAAVTELGLPPTVGLYSAPGPAIHILLTLGARASMLVVGARGHGAVIGQRFGEIATACLWQAPCPVMTIDRSGVLVRSSDLRPHLVEAGVPLVV